MFWQLSHANEYNLSHETIKKRRYCRVLCRGTQTNGQSIESSESHIPLVFTAGSGHVPRELGASGHLIVWTIRCHFLSAAAAARPPNVRMITAWSPDYGRP